MLRSFATIPATLAHETVSVTSGEAVTTVGTGALIRIVEPQPLRANELQFVDAGERDANWVTTWTADTVRTTDRITWVGRVYRVTQVSDRSPYGFYRVVMREVTSHVG